jgi:ParB family transcriptional regulator, chromosome partitioning protein
MKRRQLVQTLLTPEGNDGHQLIEPPMRATSGAVRAMGLEVGRLTEGAREADELRNQLSKGASVVDLPADKIDPSFVSDRLARTGDTEYRQLVTSIREDGQQIPILVRPHPTSPGRYQVAYGHRRLQAALELRIPVKAVVRQMSDAELVIAQGKENSQRRNLSFIERALFAVTLEQRGFSRGTINSALGIHTSETTRLLSVATSVPEYLIRKIGPAPRAGRLRWMELARELERPGITDAVNTVLERPSVKGLSSDGRFYAAIEALRAQTSHSSETNDIINDAKGEPVIRIERGRYNVRFTVDERVFPGLSEIVIRELQNLLDRLPSPERSGAA